MIRVLLVDDHAVVRTGFRLLLQAHPDITVVGEADSGENACQRYLELNPDVVVMDLAMPGMGGLEALRRIRAHQPQARVLALSAHDDPQHARRALREGARGFLSKRSAPEALLATYEEERRPIAGGMLDLSTKLLDELKKRGGMRRGRDTQQLDIGYSESALSLERPLRISGLRAGDRAPWPKAAEGGHR